MNLNLLKLKVIQKFPYIGKFLHFNYGLILEPLKETDYVFGASPLNKKILQPNGDWSEYLPAPERQSGRNLETMACTNFAALNVLEALFKRKYGLDKNFSDRFLAKMSGTGRNGNLQTTVLDTIRKIGLVNEEDWPSNMDEFNWSEYYKEIPKDIKDKAKLFLNEYEVGYEAITPTITAMKEALKYSPLYVAGYAWYYSNGYYRSIGSPNHCFILYNIDQAIAYKKAFDSYDPFAKKLSSDFTIYYPKLITLNKKGEQYNTAEILNLIKRGLKYIMRVQAGGEIYEVSTEGLKYVSPEEWNNINVQMSANQKKLVGISEEYFQSLIL
jgi:hypothetical protein